MRSMCAAIIALSAFSDQAIKVYIRSMLQGTVLFSIPGLLEIVPCINTGAAFSLFSGKPLALALFSATLILFVGCYIRKTMHLSKIAILAFSVLLGGGLGNMIDRILFGGVTDYIRLLFIRFPVFNLADIMITLSAVVLLVLMMTNRLETHSGEENGKKY